MKINCIFIFFFLIYHTALSQGSTIIKGSVKDNQGNWLGYASISNTKHSSGICADSLGVFSLELPATDTLLISSLGFETIKVPVKKITENFITFYLKESPVFLDEVLVSPTNKLTTFGIQNSKPDTRIKAQIKNNFEICLLINNPDKLQGALKKVSYYIIKGGKHNTPFRVRIYSLDNNGLPDEDLLTQSIVVKSNSFNKWYEVNLSKKNISFPENGIGIAMEWLYTAEKAYSYEDNNLKSFGQKIGAVKGTAFNHCIRSNQGKWVKINYPSGLTIAPMINCEISVYQF